MNGIKNLENKWKANGKSVKLYNIYLPMRCRLRYKKELPIAESRRIANNRSKSDLSNYHLRENYSDDCFQKICKLRSFFHLRVLISVHNFSILFCTV